MSTGVSVQTRLITSQPEIECLRWLIKLRDCWTFWLITLGRSGTVSRLLVTLWGRISLVSIHFQLNLYFLIKKSNNIIFINNLRVDRQTNDWKNTNDFRHGPCWTIICYECSEWTIWCPWCCLHRRSANKCGWNGIQRSTCTSRLLSKLGISVRTDEFQTFIIQKLYLHSPHSQPGCGVDLSGQCAHSRAHALFAESINSNRFVARRCNNYQEIVNRSCNGAGTAIMGGEPGNIGLTGIFFFQTNSNSPFAMG